MKYKLKYLYLFLLLFILVGCEKEEEQKVPNPTPEITEKLEIYNLNDLHGAILENDEQIGFSKIGHYLKEKDALDLKRVTIASGDMLQGEALSNYFYGESIIEIMNDLSFDAFVLGNHEFDWGIDKVTRYFDPNYPGIKADFDLLGANVIDKRTGEIMEFVKPYTVVEKGTLKVGIIGVMGDGLESSISGDKINDYYFSDAYQAVKKYSKILRTTEKVDVVIVSMHGASETANQMISNLYGDELVDALLNGHTHSKYQRFLLGQNRQTPMPVIQSGSKGENLGNITLTIKDKKVTNYRVQNFDKASGLFNIKDEVLETIIDKYYIELKNMGFYDEVLKSDRYYSKDEITTYLAYQMKDYAKADIGINNTQGTRDYISSGESMSVSKIYQLTPFDNEILIFNMLGKEIKKNINNNSRYLKYSSDIPLEDFLDDQVYKVATNIYIYEATTYYTFKTKHIGEAIIAEKSTIPVFIEYLELQKTLGNTHFKLDFNQSIHNNPLKENLTQKRSFDFFFFVKTLNPT